MSSRDGNNEIDEIHIILLQVNDVQRRKQSMAPRLDVVELASNHAIAPVPSLVAAWRTRVL